MTLCWRATLEKCCSAEQRFRQLLVEAQWSAAWYRVQSRRSHQSWTELLMRPLTPCWRWGHTASHLEPITLEGLWHRPSSQTPIALHAHALLSNTALTTLPPTFLCFSQQNSLRFPHCYKWCSRFHLLSRQSSNKRPNDTRWWFWMKKG